MKHLLRSYLINLGVLWTVTQVLPALSINEGIKGLLIGALAFMATNIILVPMLKILLLPLNLLTLGVFAWLGNVLALYFLVTVVPSFKLSAYHFPGFIVDGFIVPSMELSSFMVVVVASFIISFLTHFINWLIR